MLHRQLLPTKHSRRNRYADEEHQGQGRHVAGMRGPSLAAPDTSEKRHGIRQRQNAGHGLQHRRQSVNGSEQARQTEHGIQDHRANRLCEASVGTMLAMRNPIDTMLSVLKSNASPNDTRGASMPAG